MHIDRETVLQVFGVEAAEQLAQLEEGLVRLEGALDEELARALFRAAHSLKGNASLVGAQAVVGTAHLLEEALEALVQGRLAMSSHLATLLLKAVDEVRRLLPRAFDVDARPGPSTEALRAWLGDNCETPAPGVDAAAPTHPAGGGQEVRHSSVRVSISRLDKMVDLFGEITIARERLTRLLTAHATPQELLDAQEEGDALFLELQEQLMRARMVSIGPLFRQHRRTVRDLALAHGKQVQLDLEGEDVEVDLAVMEGLRDPLAHLIRNAIDHGIEAPPARRQAGKPPTGRLTLRARYQGGRVQVELEDDGAGLDGARILARARAVGLVAPDATPDEKTLNDLIFTPGFSTADAVGDLSGRGIGMDVVRRNVAALRGVVQVASCAGQGTTVTVTLPLTLAIIESLTVGAGGDTFVLPLESVEECVDLPAASRAEGRDDGVLNLRGQPLPWARLRTLLGLPPVAAARESVVVVKHEGRFAGLAVDALHGEGQTVIRPLPALFDEVPDVSGTAVLGDGRVALILDIPRLLQHVEAGAETESG